MVAEPDVDGAATHAVALAMFSGLDDTHPTPAVFTLEQLALFLTEHEERYGRKHGQLWSPTEYRPGTTRAAENVLCLSCLVLDFDGTTTYEDGAESGGWERYFHIVHSTHRHTDSEPRFRAVFPLASPVPANEWALVHRELTNVLCSGLNDPSCSDAGRFYFTPSCAPGSPRFSRVAPGPLLDPCEFPDRPVCNPERQSVNAPGQVCARRPAEEILERYINRAAHGNRNTTGTQLAMQLRDNGYEQHESLAVMMEYADAVGGGADPYTRTEAARTVRSVYKRPSREPWSAPGSRLPCSSLDVSVSPGDAVPFPVDVLPEPLRRLVVEGAASLSAQCPADLLAVPLLANLGAAIGSSRVIRVKPGWTEGPRLWVACVADPGSHKSPALDIVSAPFRARQQRFQADYKREKAAFDAEMTDYEDWKQDKKLAAVGQVRPSKPAAPMLTQIMTTDATMESLAALLQHNPRGILFHQDELTGWARGMNQYKGGKGSDRQKWLSFWSGAPIIVNRKSAETILLSAPFVCVSGALPPDTLGDLVDEKGREDGFIHRLLFSYPDRVPRGWTDATVSEHTAVRADAVFQSLWELAPIEGEPVALALSAEAKTSWVEWFNDHSGEFNHADFPEVLRGPWAKMDGYCARLALILQLSRAASGEADDDAIDEVSVEGAAALIEFFKAHARRVYSRLQATPEDRQAGAAVAWIRGHGGRATARDLLRHKVAGVKDSAEVTLLLNRLVERGLGRLEDKGRGSVEFSLFDTTRHSTGGP